MFSPVIAVFKHDFTHIYVIVRAKCYGHLIGVRKLREYFSCMCIKFGHSVELIEAGRELPL